MVSHIRLQHFRSYRDTSFRFGNAVNIIVGANATGKTNLLEALLVMARGSSYRARDSELIAFGDDWARIDAGLDVENEQRVVKLQRLDHETAHVSKSFEINQQSLKRLHRIRSLPVVLFEPNHLLQLSSLPELRRNFLDDLAEQIEPSFAALRQHYRRVLIQRNALLKQPTIDLSAQLFVWDLRLSELGGKIAKTRLELIERCNAQLTDIYRELVDAPEVISLRYYTPFTGDYESQLLNRLEQDHRLDVARGFTAHGPHRDDLMILLNDHSLQTAASRGETRSVVLALKIIELHLLEQMGGIKPMLLLDDVFSELDSRRREALTHFVAKYQAFITTTDAADVSRSFASRTIIRL
ncbi:MAG TPA: DNA replication and repair protein RecF [Candidatus Saccharimonadales bacterium]|nr:DNA replication and repair protein RecF [Candidatus Saccharimonadales bacterium]